MLSVLMVPLPRGDTGLMCYQQKLLWRIETGRDAVIEEGPSVVLSLSGSTGLDSRWVPFAPMTWLRGGSTEAHGGKSGGEVLQEPLAADPVVVEGPSVVLFLSGSTGLDSRRVPFAPITWLRGGSTGVHGD